MIDYIFSDVALAVAIGSIFQEVLHWYGLRTRLHLKSTQRLLRSPLYWLMTVLMMGLSIFGVFFWFDGQPGEQSLRDMFVFGAAFPMIFKSVVKSMTSREPVNLGGVASGTAENRKEGFLRSYFGG